MNVPPEDVEAYLAAQTDDMRSALQQLREVIRKAAPEAVETISYQVPTFKHHGPLVSFGAAKSHCSFYVMSTEVMAAYRDDLDGYDTSKGTVRFKPGEPLPAALVTKLVAARVDENETRAAAKARK